MDQDFFNSLRLKTASVVKGIKLSAPPKKIKSPTKAKTLNLFLGDTHFSAALKQEESASSYQAEDEARRLSYIVYETANYLVQNDITQLNIHLLGDLIQGKIHDIQSGDPLTQQVCSCIRLLSQAVAYLSQVASKVNIYCTPGNHGRNISRHVNRAVSQKWDSIETIIYFALKNIVTNNRVKMEIPLTPYYLFRAYGQTGFVAHGDTVLNVGNPNKTISTSVIRKVITDIGSKFAQENTPISLYALGHVHVASEIHLPEGVLITNGALVPTDDYGLSIGIFDCLCGQWLVESTPDSLCHRSHFIAIPKSIDSFDYQGIVEPLPATETSLPIL